MEEDETFDEFYAKLKNIVNSAFNLREQIPEPKIPLTELIGNLQTYELVWLDSEKEAKVRVWHWRLRVMRLISL